jgi:hypothetical protein
MYKKSKIAVLLLVGIFLVIGTTFALDKENTLEAALKESLFQQGLTFSDLENITFRYYKDPQPEKLILALKAILATKDFTSDQDVFPMYSHLISTVAHNDKIFFEKLSSLKDDYTGPEKQIIETMLKEANDFFSPEPDSAGHLDYLWAEFFATGDAGPVKKIISVLGYKNPDEDDPAHPKTQMGGLISVANWSLGPNAKQHEAVTKILEQEEAVAAEPIKSKLKAILIFNEIEKQ